jgi:hypothetical protein
VEEEQINVEIIAVDVQADLPANEGEAWPEFLEGFGDSASEGILQVSFGDFTG